MHKPQEQVTDFHRAIGAQSGVGPDELPVQPSQWDGAEMQLRFDLIAEEVKELHQALVDHDATEVVDALCDILYVTYGFAVSLGIDLESFFNEVHRTNMLKSQGPKRADGKQLKPEGWEGPRIEQMLINMYTYFYPQGNDPLNETSTDSTDLQSRVQRVVKDASGPGSFVSGSDVHGLLQEPPRGG